MTSTARFAGVSAAVMVCSAATAFLLGLVVMSPVVASWNAPAPTADPVAAADTAARAAAAIAAAGFAEDGLDVTASDALDSRLGDPEGGNVLGLVELGATSSMALAPYGPAYAQTYRTVNPDTGATLATEVRVDDAWFAHVVLHEYFHVLSNRLAARDALALLGQGGTMLRAYSLDAALAGYGPAALDRPAAHRGLEWAADCFAQMYGPAANPDLEAAWPYQAYLPGPDGTCDPLMRAAVVAVLAGHWPDPAVVETYAALLPADGPGPDSAALAAAAATVAAALGREVPDPVADLLPAAG